MGNDFSKGGAGIPESPPGFPRSSSSPRRQTLLVFVFHVDSPPGLSGPCGILCLLMGTNGSSLSYLLPALASLCCGLFHCSLWIGPWPCLPAVQGALGFPGPCGRFTCRFPVLWSVTCSVSSGVLFGLEALTGAPTLPSPAALSVAFPGPRSLWCSVCQLWLPPVP